MASERPLARRGVPHHLAFALTIPADQVVPRLLERPDELHPGHLNGHWALQALAALGIPVLGHHLGGTAYRRLRWTVGPDVPSVEATDITGGPA